MSDALNKLKKLKGRGLAELRVRGGQTLAAYAERSGWSSQTREPSDDALFAMLDAPRGQKFSGAASVLEHFRGRRVPALFASLADPTQTRDALQSRFGGQARELAVERARRICEGRFDLLGLRDLRFGEPVDWHLEPVAGKRTPLVHWSRIDYLDAGVAGDKKIIWELNRHQHFMTLGRAYWHTGDELFAQTFVAHLGAWMDGNPPKLGINWASSLEVGVSLRRVAVGAPLFQRLARAHAGDFSPRAQVSQPPRAPPRDVSLDLLQPQHAPHGRGARTLLSGHAAAGISRRGTLARDRQPHPARTTRAAGARRRRLLRAGELLPTLHRRLLYALLHSAVADSSQNWRRRRQGGADGG